MKDVFIYLLNTSIAASFLILAILLYRIVFKKAPKYVSVILWGLVAVRLLLPVSIESDLSLIPSKQTVPYDIDMAKYPAIDSGIAAVDEVLNPAINSSLAPMPYESANPLQIITEVSSYIWLIGLAIMLIYLFSTFILLKVKLRESIKKEENIFISDYAKTPFIFGILKPKIYLPSDTDETDCDFIISHEKAHLSRKDYLWKPLGFLILSVYWFNPLLWISYILLCRDIELSADEKVMADFDEEEKALYSEALLRCSINKSNVRVCPLAFGEVGVKKRITAIKNYKKPAIIITVIAIVLCLVFSVCFLTYKRKNDEKIMSGIYYAEGILFKADENNYISSDEVPLLIFTDDDNIFIESAFSEGTTYRNLNNKNACYLSKNDYKSLFSGSKFGLDYIKERNVSVWRIDEVNKSQVITCDTIYIFLQKGSELLLGYGYNAEDGTCSIKEVYRLKMNETIPKYFMTANFTEVSDKNSFDKFSISLNPENNSMSITFGMLSSYIAIGSYEIVDNTLVFTTMDQKQAKYVFNILGNNLVYIEKDSSPHYTIRNGTEFERHYQIYPIPASTFFDLGGDGRYEYVMAQKSSIDGEFAVSFTVFARGETFPTVKVPFTEYDYINLENENGNLILVCKNQEIFNKEFKYVVEYADGTFTITKSN